MLKKMCLGVWYMLLLKNEIHADLCKELHEFIHSLCPHCLTQFGVCILYIFLPARKIFQVRVHPGMSSIVCFPRNWQGQEKDGDGSGHIQASSGTILESFFFQHPLAWVTASTRVLRFLWFLKSKSWFSYFLVYFSSQLVFQHNFCSVLSVVLVLSLCFSPICNKPWDLCCIYFSTILIRTKTFGGCAVPYNRNVKARKQSTPARSTGSRDWLFNCLCIHSYFSFIWLFIPPL